MNKYYRISDEYKFIDKRFLFIIGTRGNRKRIHFQVPQSLSKINEQEEKGK